MWGKTTQRIPSNSAYQFLLEPGGGKEKKKGGGKKSREGAIIPLTGQVNSTMWVIWLRWTPKSRGVRIAQKSSEFRRLGRVPALPQHPVIIKGLVSQMDFTVTAPGHTPADMEASSCSGRLSPMKTTCGVSGELLNKGKSLIAGQWSKRITSLFLKMWAIAV